MKNDKYSHIVLEHFKEYMLIKNEVKKTLYIKKLLIKVTKEHDILLMSFYKGYLEYMNKQYVEAENTFLSIINNKITSKFYFAHYCLGINYFANKKYDKALEYFDNAANIKNLSFALNGIGNTYLELNDFNKAKDSFLKSIKYNHNDYFAYTGLGKAYNKLGEHLDAIGEFNKAVNILPDFYHAHNGLGYAYRYLKQFEKAKDEYFIALNKAKQFTTKKQKQILSPILEGLGISYKNLTKPDIKKAIKYYKEATEFDKTYASGFLGLGFILFAENRKEEALMNFIDAETYFNKPGDAYFASVAQYHIEILREEIEFEKITNKVEFNYIPQNPLVQILVKTHKIEFEILKKQKSFLTWVVKPKEKNADELYIKVLRRWNSYTPIVADNYNISKGGGYFLKAFGKGIVIDPGFNFIENFKGAGHYFDEIDFVFISHAHNDHTSDMESILSLLHIVNQSRKGKDPEYFSEEETTRHDLAKEKKIAIAKVEEKDIDTNFSKSEKRRKTIHFYFTKSVAKKFSGILNLFESDNYVYHILEAADKKIINKTTDEIHNYLEIETIEAFHNDVISKRDSVGFIFHLQDKMLLYTGDTGWNTDIEAKYKQISFDNQRKQIILLCHLGGFKAHESKYIISEGNESCYYKNHLGRLGIGKLVQTLNPHLCFISEFGEEFKNNRAEICKIYQEIFPETIFIPADIGLDYRFKTNQIKAISKINIEKKDYEEELIEPSSIESFLLEKDFSLHYYNKNSDINVKDLAEVLSYKYNKSQKK